MERSKTGHGSESSQPGKVSRCWLGRMELMPTSFFSGANAMRVAVSRPSVLGERGAGIRSGLCAQTDPRATAIAW
jgi:hypothetical protein